MTAVVEPRPILREPLFTAEEVAEALGVAARTIYKLVREGDMRCVRVGRLVRIPESAVAEFVDAGGAR